MGNLLKKNTKTNDLTLALLKSQLSYNPDTGHFTRLVFSSSRAKIGDIAGGPDGKGYIRIRINGKRYLAHRLAWFYMKGQWPKKHIDHKDTIGIHNWWDNLREADYSQNGMNRGKLSNNKSGHKGVSWHKHSKKWRVDISINKKQVQIGAFSNIEDAIKAYDKAAEEHHLEFKNTG